MNKYLYDFLMDKLIVNPKNINDIKCTDGTDRALEANFKNDYIFNLARSLDSKRSAYLRELNKGQKIELDKGLVGCIKGVLSGPVSGDQSLVGDEEWPYIKVYAPEEKTAWSASISCSW